MVVSVHRRRINSEEKAKVVVALWEAECIQFLAAPAILHYRMILKKRIILAGPIHPILQMAQVQNS